MNEIKTIDFKLNHLDKTMMFPFFINKVDEKFFKNEEIVSKHFHLKYKHKRSKFYKSNKILFEDYEKLLDLPNEDKVSTIINAIVKKMVMKTGNKKSEFFKILGQKEGQPVFVGLDNDYALKKQILANYHDEKRFSYKLEVDENSHLAKLAKKINLSFYLDHTKKKIIGAFSFEGIDRNNFNLVDAIDDFYLSNFIFSFIKEQFFPLCLDNILSLLDDNHDCECELSNIRLEKFIDLKRINLSDLEAHWKEAINHNFLEHVTNISQARRDFLVNDLLYEILIIVLIMIFSIEELKNFFTNEKPEELIEVLNQTDFINNDSELGLKDDFLAMLKIVKEIHSQNQMHKKITLDEKLSLSKLNKSFEYYYFCDPVLINNISINHLIDPTKIREFLIKNDDYFNYLFLLLYSEKFRLKNNSISQFESLTALKLNFMKLYEFDKATYLENMLIHLCENDLYIHSFIRHDCVVLLNCFNKEHYGLTPYQPYYLWSEIFIQTRLYELRLIREIKESIQKSKVKWKNILYRKIMRDMNDIYYDDEDHFYGVTSIATIINRINLETQFDENFERLNLDIQFEDELWKRGTERSNFMLAFVVAIMVGFLNYFSMVFSATSDSQIVGQGWPGIDGHFPWVYSALGVASAIELMNMCILGFAVFRAVYTKIKYEQIDDHCFEK